jgi:putative aminopeptidase FrvX
MNKRQTDFLFQLFSQPSAPFREQAILEVVQSLLRRRKIPHFIDPVGNIVVGVNNSQQYSKLVNAKSREPVRMFIAHMDHPGFHGQQWLRPKRLKIVWHGGSPTRFLSGAPVWLASGTNYVATGVIRKPVLNSTRRFLQSAEVQLESKGLYEEFSDPTRIYGGVKFRKPVWQAGKKIYTRAADDLVGVYSIVQTALSLYAKNMRPGSSPFIGLITRGEEVGFVGAVGHFELGWLDNATRKVVAVSLEASRTLPGAEIGRGPVLRLGDWRTVFSSGGLKVLADVGQKLLKGRHQRRLMDGGSCEASAAIAWGLETIGMSVPLGNYHNQSLEGGPQSRGPNGPAPEFVHIDDIDGMVKMCRGLMAPGLSWNDPWRDQRARLKKNRKNYRRLLQAF